MRGFDTKAHFYKKSAQDQSLVLNFSSEISMLMRQIYCTAKHNKKYSVSS